LADNFYNNNATNLAQQYLSQTFEKVHQNWAKLLPSILSNPNARILDLGAGSGRDAKYIADQAQETHKETNNIQVIAVEPAKELLKLGQRYTKGTKIRWLSDSLPELRHVIKLKTRFELILLSAVWMHVAPEERAYAIRKLACILKSGGKIVVSLRYGQTEEEFTKRDMHVVCADELKRLASEVGLFCTLETSIESDKLGRDHVSWQTVVLQAT